MKDMIGFGESAYTRREILKLMLGAGTWLVGARLMGAERSTQLRRVIPSSGELVPAIGLGTAGAFDVGTEKTERHPLRDVLRLFVAMGGTLIDSSPMYGNAETVVGDLARELRVKEELFLATKVWTEGGEAGVRQMEQSMLRLGTERMDLMQVHNLIDWRTHLKTLQHWKAQGRIRYAGITHYERGAFEDLERVMRVEPIDFVQLNYSIAEPEAEQRLLPLAAERGIAVIVNRPFAKAQLFRRVRGKSLPAWARTFDCTSWAQYFLKFILSHPAVTCTIPATSKPEHLVDNMQAGLGRLPDGQARQKMIAYVKAR